MAASEVEANENDEIKSILMKYKNVAVIGLSPSLERASNQVAEYLINAGYKVVGVRPGSESILGKKVYPQTRDVKEPLEIVDVFRASEHVASLIEELIPLKPKVIWLQLGVSDEQAEEKARKAGIQVISNRCIKIEHARLQYR